MCDCFTFSSTSSLSPSWLLSCERENLIYIEYTSEAESERDDRRFFFSFHTHTNQCPFKCWHLVFVIESFFVNDSHLFE